MFKHLSVLSVHTLPNIETTFAVQTPLCLLFFMPSSIQWCLVFGIRTQVARSCLGCHTQTAALSRNPVSQLDTVRWGKLESLSAPNAFARAHTRFKINNLSTAVCSIARLHLFHLLAATGCCFFMLGFNLHIPIRPFFFVAVARVVVVVPCGNSPSISFITRNRENCDALSCQSESAEFYRYACLCLCLCRWDEGRELVL